MLFGYNKYGQCGQNNYFAAVLGPTPVYRPVNRWTKKLEGIPAVKWVSCGAFSTYMMTKKGDQLWVCGSNTRCQLALPRKEPKVGLGGRF